jgi:hypothetical protein
MTLTDLQARIRLLRVSARRIFFLDGLGRLLMVAVGLIAFLFLADYYLSLPAAARAVLFLLGLSILAVAFSRFLAFPLRAPITDDDIVLSVERAHPGLKDSLISALQLSRRGDETSRKIMSPALVEATTRKALEEAASISFRSVLSSRRSLRKFAVGAVGALILVVVAALHPETTTIFLARVYGGSTPWPARSHITVLSPESERTRIAAGEDLVARVRIDGVVPSRVWIRYRFLETEEEGEARMMKTGEDVFQFVFSRLVSPIECSVEAGDAEPRRFTVDVQQPPRVMAIRLWITPPAYTKAPPTPADQPLQDGNIRAPSGSKARLRIEVSKPVKSVRMVFQPSGKFREMPKTGPQTVEAEFDVVQDARYAVRVVDEEDLENRTPSRFAIRALKDRRPRISVARPETTSLWVSPQATLPVRFTVKDDFGVNEVSLSLVRSSREHGPLTIPLDPVEAAGNGKWGPASAEYAAQVDLGTLEIPGEDGNRKAEEGDLILLLMEATDFRTPKPNRTPSAEYRLTVVSRAKLERLIEERMIQIKDTLRRARDRQETVRSEVQELQTLLEAEEVWDAGDREKLLSCQTGQRTVAQRLNTAAREMERILDTVLTNKLGDPEYQRKIEDMGGITRHLSEERCPDALAGMEFARSAATRSGQQKGLSEALQVQADIVQALEDLLQRMKKWEDYNEVIKVVREIKDLQQAVHQETLKAAKEKEKEKKKNEGK